MMKEFDRTLNYNDVIACDKNTFYEETTLTVISNITLKPVFNKFIHYYNDKLEIKYIDANMYSASKVQLDISLIILNIRELAPYLYYHFYELKKEEVSKEIKKLEDYIQILYSKLKGESRIVFFSDFESEVDRNDTIGQLSFQYVIDRLNKYVKNIMQDTDQFYMMNMDKIIAKVGYTNFYNKLNYYHTNSPYSVLACNILAYSLLFYFEQIRNQSKKCLILDCDNVLWGGIIGEDGIEGILLSNQFMGRAYLDFQREIIKLYYQGVIICLCSKNKLSDIKEVISKHPDMLLREKYIAAMKINYRNKADNLRELAKELNISINSMVFIDDNPYEISLVNYELPDVITVQLNAQRPYKYSEILKELKYFYKKKITRNDPLRGKQYKEQEIRSQSMSLYTNIEEYHKSLKTQITINKVDKYSISRVAELSQRTNQFNLSGMHYSLEELQSLLKMDYEILYLRAKDKFGDMGIVAAVIVRICKDHAIIEAMFLSCRVFGRGFELALLEEIKKIVSNKNINKLLGVYIMNSKNEIFKDFYKENNISLYHDIMSPE